MKYIKFLIIASFLFVAGLVFAEVPGHVPDWDNKCGQGFQWSRTVAACKQADCPAGAKGRTYTLECKCDDGLIANSENGLLVSCDPPSLIERLADAELELTDRWLSDGWWDGNSNIRILEIKNDDGSVTSLGVFPTGRTKLDEETGKYLMTFHYTTNGRDFFDSSDKAIKPPFFSRIWIGVKNWFRGDFNQEKEAEKIAKRIYADRFSRVERSTGDDSRNTFFNRADFAEMMVEYVKLRDNGQSPSQILDPNSNFSILMAVRNRSVNMLEARLFETGYKELESVKQFQK